MKKNVFILFSALFIFTVLVMSGCSSTPKTARMFDFHGTATAIPNEQVATLYFTSYNESGTYWVFRNPGTTLFMTRRNEPVIAQFIGGTPQEFYFVYRNKANGLDYPAGGLRNPMRASFTPVAGRNYQIFYNMTGARTAAFPIYEISQTREINSSEQELFIKFEDTAFGLVVVLNRGTHDERLIYLMGSVAEFRRGVGEIRIIVSRGEHTIDVITNPVFSGNWVPLSFEPNGEQPRHFTAGSEPITFTVSTIQPQRRHLRYNLTRN
jgi:hypothetical protein